MDINLSFVAGTLPAGENGMNLEESPVRRFLTKLASGEDAAIVCAGDSVTWGQHYTTADRTYTARLAELLASRFPRATVCRYDGIYLEENSPIYSYGFPVTVSNGSTSQKLHVIKSGVGGDTVARLIRRIGDYTGAVVDGIEPDLITVMVGINDSLQQDPHKYVPAAEYGNHLRALIGMIRSRTEAGLVLMTPSYNDDGTSAVSSLDPYAAAMKEVAEAEQVKLVDVHRLWMDHMILNGAVRGQGTWLSAARPGDCCHPASDGHEATALLIFRELFPDQELPVIDGFTA